MGIQEWNRAHPDRPMMIPIERGGVRITGMTRGVVNLLTMLSAGAWARLCKKVERCKAAATSTTGAECTFSTHAFDYDYELRIRVNPDGTVLVMAEKDALRLESDPRTAARH
jgi:hypothetical protein